MLALLTIRVKTVKIVVFLGIVLPQVFCRTAFLVYVMSDAHIVAHQLVELLQVLFNELVKYLVKLILKACSD